MTHPYPSALNEISLILSGNGVELDQRHWLWLTAPGEQKMATAKIAVLPLSLWQDDL